MTNYFPLAATVPELLCGEVTVQEPTSILNFLRKRVRDEARHFFILSSELQQLLHLLYE